LALGSASCDIFLDGTQLPTYMPATDGPAYLLVEEGTKNELECIRYIAGGGCVNAATVLRRIGFDNVSMVSKIGADQTGRFLLDYLRKAGVDTACIVVSENILTGTSFVLPAQSGNRPILVYRGANDTLVPSDLHMVACAPHDVCGHDGLYIAPLAGLSAKLLPDFLPEVRASATGMLIAHNPSAYQINDPKGSGLLAIIPTLDILLCNMQEARLFLSRLLELPKMRKILAKIDAQGQLPKRRLSREPLQVREPLCAPEPYTVMHFLSLLCTLGPRFAIATDGANGAFLFSRESSTLSYLASIPTTVTNTVGAGDTFGSTFFGFLAMGFAQDIAFAAAMANSSSVLSSTHLSLGALPMDDILTSAHKLVRLIQHFECS